MRCVGQESSKRFSHQTQDIVQRWSQSLSARLATVCKSVCSHSNCLFCPTVVRQCLIVDGDLILMLYCMQYTVQCTARVMYVFCHCIVYPEGFFLVLWFHIARSVSKPSQLFYAGYYSPWFKDMPAFDGSRETAVCPVIGYLKTQPHLYYRPG